jgi:hypothetical protein
MRDDQPFTDEEFVGLPDCPDWCEEKGTTGRHTYADRSDGSGMIRSHYHFLGSGLVHLVTEDEATIGQPVRRRQPRLQITPELVQGDLTAEEVRKIAAELLEATDAYERIVGGQ